MQRFFKVISYTAFLTFIKMLCGIFISKAIAIYAGPSGMALFGQMQGFTTMLTNLGNSPNNSGVIKYTAEFEHKGIDVYSQWWKAAIYWSFFVYITLFMLVVFFSEEISIFLTGKNDYRWLVISAGMLIPLSALGVLCSSIYNSFRDYKNFFLSGMISTLITSVVIIYIILSYGLIGAMVAAVIQPALIGGGVFIFSLKEKWCRLKYFIGPITKGAKNDILKYVAMISVSAIVGPLSIIILRTFLIEQVGWEIAGEWQSVWKISEVYLGVITLTLSTYYLPVLAKTRDYQQLVLELRRTVKVIFPLIVLMAIFIYILRDYIIYILFSKDFYNARELFLIQLL
ncbi:TPA: O63 family O-antigen flippase, partial [Escherichia coli]|nr:O63 family O-antigen flippase [Escherichia coli]